MSISGQFRAVSRCRRLFVFVLGVLLVTPIASAGPQLWLYPQDAGPREGGHIVPPKSFILVVENRGKPSDENGAQGVELVVAVNDPASITAFSLSRLDNGTPLVLGEWKDGTPELLCDGKLMPRHGVYPALYATTLLGDLAGGESIEIDVTVEAGSDLRAHFDAMGTAWKTNRNGEKCSDVLNPAGHDVTVGQRPGGRDDCGHVRIMKTGDEKFVDLGDAVIFTIDVLNEGSCDLTDPVLRDFIPAVDDGKGGSVPAFMWTEEGTDPPPIEINDFLLEWTLDSPLVAGDQDGVVLKVVFDDPLADGQRVVNRACISAAELHKPRCAAAVIIVGNPNGEDGPAGPGFWCHAVRFILEDRHNAPIDAEDYEKWLFEIGEGSNVFHDEPDEPYDASTLEEAQDLLCTPQTAQGAADRLARHLLTLWLNVVSGRLDPELPLGDLCDGDEIMPDGVDPEIIDAWDLIVAVEDALVLPAEDQELTFWSEVVDAVNNSLVPGEPGCTAARLTSGRQRAGNGKPGSKMKIPGVHN
jgi:uncharacterized repeat protein (TIGR01451 family)